MNPQKRIKDNCSNFIRFFIATVSATTGTRKEKKNDAQYFQLFLYVSLSFYSNEVENKVSNRQDHTINKNLLHYIIHKHLRELHKGTKSTEISIYRNREIKGPGKYNVISSLCCYVDYDALSLSFFVDDEYKLILSTDQAISEI